MKGTLSNLSAFRATSFAARLETAAKDGDMSGSRALLAKLEAAMPEVDQALAGLTAEVAA